MFQAKLITMFVVLDYAWATYNPKSLCPVTFVRGEEDPLKIGRSVAKLKPSADNAIFDCKVLSRNHAVLWYSNGDFFLRDTKSSNGTFVNNERLAPTGEESTPRQIHSGDIIQFGVEIVENANKVVTHGCIFAMIRLYDENGEEVEPQREKCRDEKLGQLEVAIESCGIATDGAWKSFLSEDRLLARIATLEEQLSVYQRSKTLEPLQAELDQLYAEKARAAAKARDDVAKAQEERAEAELRYKDTERSLVSTEETRQVLKNELADTKDRLESFMIAFEEFKAEKKLEFMELDAQKNNIRNGSSEGILRKLKQIIEGDEEASPSSSLALVQEVINSQLNSLQESNKDSSPEENEEEHSPKNKTDAETLVHPEALQTSTNHSFSECTDDASVIPQSKEQLSEVISLQEFTQLKQELEMYKQKMLDLAEEHSKEIEAERAKAEDMLLKAIEANEKKLEEAKQEEEMMKLEVADLEVLNAPSDPYADNSVLLTSVLPIFSFIVLLITSLVNGIQRRLGYKND